MHPPLREFQHAASSPRHIGRSMRSRYPRLAAAARGIEHRIDAPPIIGIEPIVELVQQQPVRILYQGARHERKTLLSIRQG